MNDRNLKEYGLSAHCLLSQNISLKLSLFKLLSNISDLVLGICHYQKIF